jgi:hypothetical protein
MLVYMYPTGTMGLGMEAKLAREEQAKLDEALAKRRRLDNELPSDFRDRMRDERRRYMRTAHFIYHLSKRRSSAALSPLQKMLGSLPAVL